MAQVTSYPYQLSESILAPSPTEMWTDPMLYEDILPPRKQQPMNTSFPAVTATPAWRPARVFPSEKYVPLAPRPRSRPHRSPQVRRRGRTGRLPRPLAPAHGRVSALRPPSQSPHSAHSPCSCSRITMIDYRGFVVYDTYVRPTYVPPPPPSSYLS